MKLAAVFLTFGFILFISDIYTKHECMPENNMFIPANAKLSPSGVTEQGFLQAIKEFEDIYTPIFKDDYGATLKIIGDWEDGTVNAYARQVGKSWQVNMFGGLARHPEATLDGFRAVLCHEIGHHIAGAPKKKSRWITAWASNEGQSDYYATTKCLRKFYASLGQIHKTRIVYLNHQPLDDEEKFAKQKCEETYNDMDDAAACFRSSLAGKSLARLLGSLRGNPDVYFSKPDPTVVSKTDHNHPKAQCRMDTYFQGALCANDQDELADPQDVRKGYCTAVEGHQIGIRPACWYAASEYE
jgi:hypothetical protein